MSENGAVVNIPYSEIRGKGFTMDAKFDAVPFDLEYSKKIELKTSRLVRTHLSFPHPSLLPKMSKECSAPTIHWNYFFLARKPSLTINANPKPKLS